MAPNGAKVVASQAELDRRKVVGVNLETVTDVTSTDFPGHWPGEDHSWSIEKFREACSVQFYKRSNLETEFSLIGVDASIANAYRRIMIGEIPSLAIERVYIYNNTSIIQDEVLSARLGLIPLTLPGGVRKLKWCAKPEEGEEVESNDSNTIRLSLKIACTHNRDAAPGERDPLKAYHHAHVYARDIKWIPFGNQVEVFGGEDAITALNPDILIAKMRPGQVMDIEMDAILGVGSDHTKYSPVAPASYRLLPTIDILKPIIGADAEKFSRCFPPGVIELQPISKKEAAKAGSGYEGHEGEKRAVVVNAMKDTVSRECLRHDEFKDKVRLGRIRDHFIFSVESVGQWNSDELFLESVALLRNKAEALQAQVRALPQ
ncbi:hypothetical protein HYALB_00003437 [Hymenoscyphus albidus]|uniref:DNA-directed RNA polymerases I and III subunit RPAC1 n=1 Tax=Hymenoscyphus albidus TaxID=595503 RepID=A0A9N9Q0V2_9HELO|nr:hypothetical protein HYALB_00003437 [Hymenoscyphus albidus]